MPEREPGRRHRRQRRVARGAGVGPVGPGGADGFPGPDDHGRGPHVSVPGVRAARVRVGWRAPLPGNSIPARRGRARQRRADPDGGRPWRCAAERRVAVSGDRRVPAGAA